MPVYEYRAEEDGEVIELIRPMSRADEPVEDPAGKGRTFTRMISVFASSGGSQGGPGGGASGGSGGGGCCPCGKGAGACSRK